MKGALPFSHAVISPFTFFRIMILSPTLLVNKLVEVSASGRWSVPMLGFQYRLVLVSTDDVLCGA